MPRGALGARGEEAAREAAIAVVGELLAELAAGRGAQASRLVAPGFGWFGRVLEADDWTGPRARVSFQGLTADPAAIRAVERGVLELIAPSDPAATATAGPLRPGELVVLADVSAGGREVTVAFVVTSERAGRSSGASAQVVRAFDPARLVAAIRSLEPPR